MVLLSLLKIILAQNGGGYCCLYKVPKSQTVFKF